VAGTELQWDSAVEPQFDFYVRVRAVNAAGAGAASNELAMSRGQRSQSPPARPDAVNASYDNGMLNVVWEPPADGQQITAFVLEIGTLPVAANLVNTTLPPTSSHWSHAAPAGRYYIRMRSLNAAGVSAASSEVVVNSGTPATELPGMPQNLVAALVGDRLQLEWVPPADGGDLIEYVIEAGTAPGVSDVASVQTGTAHSAWSYTGVPGGRVFFIRVRARNGVGLGPASTEVRIGGE
jgi:titin